jgi:hypothetical protein
MLTAVARSARDAGRPLHILSDRPEVWQDNADIAGLETGIERWFYANRRRWLTVAIKHLPSSNQLSRHLAQQQADHLGLVLPRDWKPIFHFPQSPRVARRLTFQISCRGAKYPSETKEWPLARWNELVGRLRGHYELVQLGTLHDPAIPGAHDLRGRTSLATAAQWIASSALFLGLESGLMHLAAAVTVPAVIIYGGRTRPSLTGYSSHVHLTRELSCTGCALNSGCPHDHRCLDIPVNEVEHAVRAHAIPG